MKKSTKQLVLSQIDQNMRRLNPLRDFVAPRQGWINAIRTSINMTLVQLAKRLRKTPVSVREMEQREMDKSITLKKLIEVGDALDCNFVYGFVPKESSLRAMVDKRIHTVAREIVMRTAHSMELEDQRNREERLEEAIGELAAKLKREVPRYVWD